MSNVERFPRNIYEPVEMEIGGRKQIIYKAKFSSLFDLYSYLTSNPEINEKIFESLHSETKDSDFAGVSYSKAVEELIDSPRSEFKKFLSMSEGLGSDVSDYVQEYEDVKAPGGGYIDIPAYCSGDPYCYRTSRSIYTPKFVRLYISLSYSWVTEKIQILNRALIIAAIVNALEQAGYVVEVNTFELSHTYDEWVYINVNIKNNDETFNKASLYKTLCYVEFLRRILFRVLETIDVKEYEWQSTYGQTASEEKVRKILRLEKNDIFIDQANALGIEGDNIVTDLEGTLKRLKLQDKIDVQKFKNEFEKEAKRLKRTIR